MKEFVPHLLRFFVAQMSEPLNSKVDLAGARGPDGGSAPAVPRGSEQKYHLDYVDPALETITAFDGLEEVAFSPSPSDVFWNSAPDLALSRLRKMTLYKCSRSDGAAISDGTDIDSLDFCARHFLRHSARFTNLVELCQERL